MAPTRKQIFRSTLTQAFLVGFLSFTQPGIYAAIANLGAGGQATTRTWNVSTVILNAMAVVLGPISALFANTFGLRPTLFIGCIGHTIYSASLYYNTKTGNQAFILAASVLLGISGAAFWMSEGAIVISYPEKSRKGLFIGIWQMLNKFGGVISGAVVFAMNYSGKKKGQKRQYPCRNKRGQGWPQTNGQKVSRSPEKKGDNSSATHPGSQHVVQNLAEQLYDTQLFGPRKSIERSSDCSDRGRSGLRGGAFLDCQKISVGSRAKISWLFIIFFESGFYIWGFIVQKHLAHSTDTLDWATGMYYYNTYVPMQIFKIPTEFVFNWVFWVVSVQEFSSEENAYISGLIRAVESFGSMLSFLVGVTNGNDMVNLSVAAGVFWAAVPSVTYLVFRIIRTTHINPESAIVQNKKSGEIVEITEEID
ncbi:hypothetical protein KL938_004409 [Ogataea parapolymorpha]|nr:hypothetical protein KL938_004409 [Ogataea parapolymorpha]